MDRYTAQQRREYTNSWRARRKARAIAILGGKCTVCGTDQQLEFDHIDPSSKTTTISRLWTASAEIFETELAKCQLLCKEHHAAKSRTEDARVARHGTTNMYKKHKCRCRPCTEAATGYLRQLRKKDRGDEPNIG